MSSPVAEAAEVSPSASVNVAPAASSTSSPAQSIEATINQVASEINNTTDPALFVSQLPSLVVKQVGNAKPDSANAVKFDYTGQPLELVINGMVNDLVTKFGIHNAWLAVLKLRGFNVTKKAGEQIFPIKRFRERVRKLKQTVENLKDRPDELAQYFEKEFSTTHVIGSMDPKAPPADVAPEEYVVTKAGHSKADDIIESIIKKTASEHEAELAASQAAPTKSKRGRKKNNTADQKNNSAQPTTSSGNLPSSTIDDVVSSVVNKIRNNEPFDGSSIGTPAPLLQQHQQQQQQQQPQQVVFAPQMPGQTYVVVDGEVIPFMSGPGQGSQRPQPQVLPTPPATTGRGKGKARKGKNATNAAANPSPQVVQINPYLSAGQNGLPTSSNVGGQQMVVTVPRSQNGATTYTYQPKYDNNTTVVFNSIQDLIRAHQSGNIPGGNQNGPVTKYVTYPNMNFVTGSPPGVSPAPSGYQQVAIQQPPPQYILQQNTPQQGPQLNNQPGLQSPAAASDAPAASSSTSKKTPRRKSTTNVKANNFLENFDDSDIEEFSAPKRKQAAASLKKKLATTKKVTKKGGVEKKTKETAGKKNKKQATPVSDIESPPPSPVDSEDLSGPSKNKLEIEVAHLRRQLQAERSRHYTQKRRATKLDDDYKRVLDRLQQTELNLALQMSECERLQTEMKKLTDQNNEETNDSPKPVASVTRGAKRNASTTGAGAKKAPPAKKPARSTASKKLSVDTDSQKEDTAHDDTPSADAPKPSFSIADFIPRRAAASKRIRYF